MKLEFSFDDYCKENTQLALLLKKHKLEKFTTFFIDFNCSDGNIVLNQADSWNAGLQMKQLSELGFEIGAHTITHPSDIKQLDDDLMFAEVQNSKDLIEHIINKPCEKFCYPRGRRNEKVVQTVIDSGYLEARTTEVLCTSLYNVDMFQKPTTVHIYNRKEYNEKDWLTVATEQFDLFSKGVTDYFHMWGHAWEIEKHNDWKKLDEFLQSVAKVTKLGILK